MYSWSYSGGPNIGTVKSSAGIISKVTTLMRLSIRTWELGALSSKSISNNGICTKSYKPFMSPHNCYREPESTQLTTALKTVVGVAALLNPSIASIALISTDERLICGGINFRTRTSLFHIGSKSLKSVLIVIYCFESPYPIREGYLNYILIDILVWERLVNYHVKFSIYLLNSSSKSESSSTRT